MKRLAIVLSVVLGATVVCLGGATFLGGTKIRRLFGESAEALAGPEPTAPVPTRKRVTDFGADAGTP